MQTILSNLSIGVISGLVATFIIVVIGQIWLKIILPWYENLLYQGVRLDGRWVSRARIRDSERETVWQIKQTGHRIKATAVATLGPNQGRSFAINGTFRNLILTVTFQRSDAGSVIDRGCVAVKLVQNGHQLCGHITHYDYDSETLVSNDYVLRKNQSLQHETKTTFE